MNTLLSATQQDCRQPGLKVGNSLALPTKRFRIPAPKCTRSTARKCSSIFTASSSSD